MATESLMGPEWLQWKQHPQTQELLALWRVSIQTTQDQWLNREYVGSDNYQGTVLNAAAIERARTLQDWVDTIENIQFAETKSDQ